MTLDIHPLGPAIGALVSNIDLTEPLRNTDRELLQKYSKVFFLNEHYAPPRSRGAGFGSG